MTAVHKDRQKAYKEWFVHFEEWIKNKTPDNANVLRSVAQRIMGFGDRGSFMKMPTQDIGSFTELAMDSMLNGTVSNIAIIVKHVSYTSNQILPNKEGLLNTIIDDARRFDANVPSFSVKAALFFDSMFKMKNSFAVEVTNETLDISLHQEDDGWYFSVVGETDKYKRKFKWTEIDSFVLNLVKNKSFKEKDTENVPAKFNVQTETVDRKGNITKSVS